MLADTVTCTPQEQTHLSGSRVARSMDPLMTWSMMAGSGLSH